MHLDSVNIAVIGLGYVGLPLAVEFGLRYPTIGFDINHSRISQLKTGHDTTLEVSEAELKSADRLTFTSNLHLLKECNFFIVTVPTPIDRHNRPDLSPLLSASKALGSVLKKGDFVVYESTVFPGCTEDECVPVLEEISGLKFNEDFFVGYSPERINPGDTERRLTSIIKITSGSNKDAADFIDSLYSTIINAGTYKAPSIRVAEAAKVIENTQRDVNIALINELSLIFGRLNISTEAVLKAAETKWNFLPFRPGLVGGHCIGVDPYYVTHKAQEVGYHPEIILAGRRLNDSMPLHVANQVVRLMNDKKIHIRESRVLMLGVTFKENCPDIRNSKVVDLIENLTSFGANVDVYDPWVDADAVGGEISSFLVKEPQAGMYDAVVCAVRHNEFVELGFEGVKLLCKSRHILFDVKNVFPNNFVDGRL